MKPLGYKNYGSIPHLSTSKLGEGDHYIGEGQERILTKQKRDKHDEIFVFEKYDGANVGIAKKDGKIIALMKDGYTCDSSTRWHLQEFAKEVSRYYEFFNIILKEGQRIVGELMLQPHGIQYEYEIPFIAFDFFTGQQRESIDFLLEFCNKFNMQAPRLLHRGNSIEHTELIDVLNERTPYMKSIELPEGMVYRVERKGKFDFMAKWVRHDFIAGKIMLGL